MFKKFLCSVAVVGAVLSVTPANAATIWIAYSQDGGPLTTVALSGTGDTLTATASTANFTISTAHGLTQPTLPPPGLLFSNNTDVTASVDTVSHYLDVFITAEGLTGPIANPLLFTSGLTENLLLGGFTTTLSTLLSTTDAIFTGTALSSANFNAVGGQTLNALANTGAGPYSVTADYHIVSAANQAGSSDATIGIIGTVPGPLVGAGLPGLLTGCLGLLALARRRRNGAIA